MSYTPYRGMGIASFATRQAAVDAATDEQRETARAHYARGQSLYSAGDYDGAIRAFTAAWNTIPHGVTLVSIGLTLQRLGRLQEAIYRYERFLREYGDTSFNCGATAGREAWPCIEMAQNNLATAQAALEAQSRRTGTPAPPPAPPQLPVAKLQQAQAQAPTIAQAQAAAPSPVSLPDPYVRRTSVGIWIATGVGVVGFIGLGWWLTRK